MDKIRVIHRLSTMKIGLGFDLHRLKKVKNGFLWLGGVKIPANYRILAHSDGDLLLHAASDAIAGALGLPDVGVSFPPGKTKTRGIDSRIILAHALNQAKKLKKRVVSASFVLALEEPKLGPYRDAIQRSLAHALDLSQKDIGLSFKTFEGLAPLAKKAVACWVTCLLK